MSGSQLMSVSASLAERSEKCDVCGFVVNLVGHAERCRVVVSAELLELQRKRAWFGDAWHICQVRWMLMRLLIPVKQLQTLSQQFVSSESQTEWYNRYQGKKLVALGTSMHSIATAFEASYYLLDQFRVDYIYDMSVKLGYQLTSDEFAYLGMMFDGDDFLSELRCAESDRYA